MRNPTIVLLGLAVAFNLTGICPARAQNTELTAEAVQESIRKGVNFLRSKDEEFSRFPGGLPALKALAMLNAGVSPKDPDVADLISRIRALELDNLANYTIALRIMVLAAADPEGKLYTREIRKDVDFLVASQVKEGVNTGGWFYAILSRAGGGSADPSNSQFSVLALHEAAKVGVEVDQIVWQRAAEYWQQVRNRDGGFVYSRGQRSIGSMTCAGISSWVIITENLNAANAWIQNGNVVCCGQNNQTPYIEDASNWLAKNFSVTANPGANRNADRRTHFYYMYALERAGRLAGQRFFGAHDWYREGAKRMLELQKRNGQWAGIGGNMGEAMDEISTSFALLFLAKGKRPVVFGKYKHSQNDDWDRHPKGVHQLTMNLEKAWNRKLNWQTVDAKDAKVNDLLEVRVLVISGRDNLNLTEEQKLTLKRYIESGGFVLAEACQGDGCGPSSVFDNQFRILMKELFPESKLEALPFDHPIWNIQHRLDPDPEFPLLGLQACCRTSVVYCPRTLAARWQVDRRGLREQLNQLSKTQVDWSTKIATNIAAYATGQQLRDKLDTPQADMGVEVQNLNERVLIIPKLMHSGGSDEAPNAWRNVLIEAQKTGLRIQLDKKLIQADLEQLSDHPFVFMHGRDSFQFNDDQRQAIKTYVEKGGFLLADSICASKPFTDAFRREMKIIFQDNKLEPIPANHPLWTNEKFGFAIKTVTLRRPDRNADGGFREIQTHPLMEGIKIDDRLQIIFSPFDLSCAMENTAMSQCEGYTRDQAAVISVKILLYYLRRGLDE